MRHSYTYKGSSVNFKRGSRHCMCRTVTIWPVTSRDVLGVPQSWKFLRRWWSPSGWPWWRWGPQSRCSSRQARRCTRGGCWAGYPRGSRPPEPTAEQLPETVRRDMCTNVQSRYSRGQKYVDALGRTGVAFTVSRSGHPWSGRLCRFSAVLGGTASSPGWLILKGTPVLAVRGQN